MEVPSAFDPKFLLLSTQYLTFPQYFSQSETLRPIILGIYRTPHDSLWDRGKFIIKLGAKYVIYQKLVTFL